MAVPADVIRRLERDPLGNIVLLKHLEAYPGVAVPHMVTEGAASAVLVLLPTAASAYDRATYPATEFVALLASDTPRLSAQLVERVPRGKGVIFKVSRDDDLAIVAGHFPGRLATRVLSYTAHAPMHGDPQVVVTRAPSEAAFALFSALDHDRGWLRQLLGADRAFVCELSNAGETAAACFAFENTRRIWEIGGVSIADSQRRRGFASRAVRTAVSELQRRRLLTRYQAHQENRPSIALAEAIGLERFLTISHHLHLPG